MYLFSGRAKHPANCIYLYSKYGLVYKKPLQTTTVAIHFHGDGDSYIPISFHAYTNLMSFSCCVTCLIIIPATVPVLFIELRLDFKDED